MRPGAAAAAAASFALLALPAAASAAAPAASAATSAAPQAPASVPPPTSAPAPAAGRLQIQLAGMRGASPFVLARETVVVVGHVSPFVAGQRVRVTIFRDGHRQAAKTVAVGRHGGSGEFRVRLRATLPGRMRMIAEHAPTAQLQRLSASSQDVTVIAPASLTSGARGASIWVLQRALGALHYAVPQNGYFDEATGDAVIAYRKLTGLPRVSYADAAMLRRLSRGEGAFHVRYTGDGRHVEANLSLQVLAEIDPHGKVVNIYPTSSGKPSTPTVTGRFRVYEKSPGFNSEMMFDSNYFISGYAIHGYPEVPTYAASHGCLRVPNLDAPAIYGWVQLGTPVDVYE